MTEKVEMYVREWCRYFEIYEISQNFENLQNKIK